MSRASAILACLAVPSIMAFSVSLGRHRGPRMSASPVESMGVDLCRRLQNGGPVDNMAALLTTAGARDFFNSYLTEDEWTCADTVQPPAALAESLADAPPSVLDVVLMNLVSGAASSSERSVSRARLLVNVLWARAPALRTSCAALRDTVAALSGEDVPVLWDQNYEYAKDEWAGLLYFAKYDTAQLGRIRAELALCGGDDL